MNRRQFLAALPAPLLAAAERPNIVIILADDMGWGDVSMNGCPDIHTPNIDSIAAQGARLPNFYANGPECSPTRTALLTGRYQQRVGGLECAIGVNNLGRYDEAEWLQKRGELGLPAAERTLPRILRVNGYDTACIGKWHLGYHPKYSANAHGFDYYFGILGGNANYYTHEETAEGAGQSHLYENGVKVRRKGYLTDLLTSASVEWLKARKPGKPFFLYLPYNAPHAPIQDPSLPDAPEIGRHRPTYVKMVERLDQGVGAVLHQLKDTNTLVFFLSDNGADPNGRSLPYRGLKTSVYEGGVRVPFCVRWPGRIKPGIIVGQVALTMDLLPTILAATGLEAGRAVDGIDLLPQLRDGRPAVSRTLFWRFKRAANRRKAARRGDWKLTNDSGKEELFNLAADPYEKQDQLAVQPRIAAELRTLLAAWEKDVQAPRLAGFTPAVP